MSRQFATTNSPLTKNVSALPLLPTPCLQRKCDCGGNASSMSNNCAECDRKKTVGLQTKLTVGRADDHYERQADRVAADIVGMRGQAAEVSSKLGSALINRKASGTSHEPTTAPPEVSETLHATGEPLSATSREFFEPRFGHDFGSVRIHRNAQAAASARAVSAQAYTVGNKIVFGEGKYQPESNSGRELLAHELTHVVQQSGVTNTLQRRPATNAAATAAPTRAATPADKREFASEAARFLQLQGETFSLQQDRSISDSLDLLRQTAERGLSVIADLHDADDIAANIHAAYRDAVRVLLISRSVALSDSDSTPPALPALYEQYRDKTLPFGLPQHQAVAGRNQLSAELSAPLPAGATRDQRARHNAVKSARQRLKVVTGHIQMDIPPLFDSTGGTTSTPLPANTIVRFADNTPSELHRGLRSVAAQLASISLEPNTTVMLALDLTRFGGGYDSYRFTHIDLGLKSDNEILIEQQGTIGVEGLPSEEREQMEDRFNQLGFSHDSGFSQDEFDQVLIGLSQLPDTQLTSLRSLTFERHAVDPDDPDAAGHYDQENHALRIFDNAYAADLDIDLTRAGNGAHPIGLAAASVVHEISHALDLRSLRSNAAATDVAENAMLAAFGTGGRNFRAPLRNDPSRPQFDTLNSDLKTAQAGERSARAISGARWSGGSPTEVIDQLPRKAPQPKFREAAIKDGAKESTGRGFPTTYPSPEFFWQKYFAESFALYQTAPETLQRMRPHVFDFMQQAFAQ
jgi:Domain of unknown function (DUF4157)